MTPVFRRLSCVLLNVLGRFPNSTSQREGSNKLLCYTSTKYDYFLYTDGKNWKAAEDECKKDNREMFSTTHRRNSLLQYCIRKYYNSGNTVRIWRLRTKQRHFRYHYVLYQNGRFSYYLEYYSSLSSRQFICFSEKTTKKTTSTSTSALPTTETITVKTSAQTSSTAATTIPSTVMTTRTESAIEGSTTATTSFQSTTFILVTQTKEKKTQKSHSAASGTKHGIVVGVVVGLLLLCVVVVLTVVFIIRCRKQQNKLKKENHCANVAYEIRSPDVIPSQRQNQDHSTNAEIGQPQQASDIYYNIQKVRMGNRHDKCLRQHDGETNPDSVVNSAGECIELSSCKDGASRKYKYATSTELPARSKLPEKRMMTDDADDSDTYDHINKRTCQIRRDVDNVYSHTEDDEYSHTHFKYEKGQRLENETVYSHTEDNINDEYSHTNFKYEKGQHFENENVYSHTERDEDAEYSNTNLKNEIGQDSYRDDDTYSHTHTPPSYERSV